MPERGLVVIPTYNEAANLAHLVPQVLAQDPRLDILIVDDNSPDGTGQLAEALRQKEPRLRSEEHTSELQSRGHLVCRLLLEKKKPYHFYFADHTAVVGCAAVTRFWS